MHVFAIPPDVKKGEPIKADTINKFLALFRSLDITGGPGIEVKKSSTGITIKLKTAPKMVRSSGGGGGGPTGPFPFDVTFAAGSDVDHTAATIRPGTINGLLPSGWNTPADLVLETTYYLTLAVEATDGEITAATISFETSPPEALPVQQGLPSTDFEYLLGVVFNGQWFRTIGNGSLVATGAEVYRVSKISPSPGTLPYDIYYTWAITAS